MANGIKREPPSYAGLSVVIGLVSIALGGGYWYWEYARKREKERLRAERITRDTLPGTFTPPSAPPPVYPMPQPIVTTPVVPPAQTMPVPPPTVAQVKQVQHNLNLVNRKSKGQDGYLEEDGSAGPRTHAAIKAFQTSHGMVATGKLDGMTLSLLGKTANESKSLTERARDLFAGRTGAFHFVLRWMEPTFFTRTMGDHGHWVVEDSMHFVNEIGRDRSHPPSEADIVSFLIKHYGPESSVGKALRAHQFENWGIAAQVEMPKSDHVAGYGSFYTGAGTSFEEAWSHAGQSYVPGGTHVPDLTADQLAQPFAGGAFLNTCAVPEDMSVLIKAAVQNGRAVGVTVTTTPPSARHAGCIDAAVRRMQFPVNPNLDAVTQTF